MEQQQHDQLFDKRDTKYIQLRSMNFFYEMCTKKKLKLELVTPQTIIFEKGKKIKINQIEGQPRLWLFNSKKSKLPAILRKNSDKLNIIEVTKSLLQVKNTDDWRIDSIQTLYELLKGSQQYNNPQPVVFLRMSGNQRRFQSCSEFLKLLMDGKEISSISIIQSYVQNHSIANEIYYCEYRNDVDMMPSTFKFYKKTITKKKEPLKHAKSEVNPFQQLLRSSTKSPEKLPEIPQAVKNIEVIFKYFDATLNAKFQENTKKAVDYIIAAFNIKVKKVICKYIVSKSGEIFYLGIKDLLIEINENGPYDPKQLNEELMSYNNRQFEQFMSITKMLRRQVNQRSSKDKLPNQIVENSKTISSTLYKKLILEKCGGDFCDFIMLEKNKGPLQLRKGIMENYKSAFTQKNNTLENIQQRLPFEISFQLILRARECADEVIKLFQKHRIQLKGSPGYEENQAFDLNIEFPFRQMKKEVYNLESLYKKVKICKTCFVLYSMVAKNFDKSLKIDLKRKTWQQFTKIEEAPELTLPSQKADDLIRSKTEQRFRFINTAAKPKAIKVFVVPHHDVNEHHSKTAQATRLDKASSQIEINRLALGYLNYQKIAKFKHPPVIQHRPSFLGQEINLIAMLAQERTEPTRKLDSNQNENIHLIKLNEDLKQLKQDVTNDSEIRQIQQQYCQQKSQTMKLEHMYTTSYYYYHANFTHLRRIHKFRLSTPLQPVTDDLKYDKLRPLIWDSLQLVQNFPELPFDLPELEFFVVDEKTVVPYILLEGLITQARVRNKSQKQVQSGVELIIFLQDMFESFLEYYSLCLDLISKVQNRRILMLNIPGQAYTLYQNSNGLGGNANSSGSTNLNVSAIIDMILYQLHENLQIDLFYDTVKLVGIGSGGFHLQAFLCEAHGNIHYLQSLTLINSFSKVNIQMRSLLEQSKQIFESQPKDMPELPFEYTSTLMNTKPLDISEINRMMKKNPITTQGRIAVIEGLLNSQSLIDRFERILITVQVYHSLKNCLVNIAEADALSKFVQDDLGDLNNPLMTKKLAQTKRTIEYFEGGHSILSENKEYLINILKRVIY